MRNRIATCIAVLGGACLTLPAHARPVTNASAFIAGQRGADGIVIGRRDLGTRSAVVAGCRGVRALRRYPSRTTIASPAAGAWKNDDDAANDEGPMRTPAEAAATTRDYLRSRWVRSGLWLLLGGAAPLVFVVLAAAVGLWPDPNPNPVGPGLLFFLTFWPAVACIVVGVVRVQLARRRGVSGR